MTKKKVVKFFDNPSGFISLGNNSFRSVQSKEKKTFIQYILFNKTLVVVRQEERSKEPVLLGMYAFSDISDLVAMQNGDVFIGSKRLSKIEFKNWNKKDAVLPPANPVKERSDIWEQDNSLEQISEKKPNDTAESKLLQEEKPLNERNDIKEVKLGKIFNESRLNSNKRTITLDEYIEYKKKYYHLEMIKQHNLLVKEYDQVNKWGGLRTARDELYITERKKEIEAKINNITSKIGTDIPQMSAAMMEEANYFLGMLSLQVSDPIGLKGINGGQVLFDKKEYSDGWRFKEASTSDLPIITYYQNAIKECGKITENGLSKCIIPSIDDLKMISFGDEIDQYYMSDSLVDCYKRSTYKYDYYAGDEFIGSDNIPNLYIYIYNPSGKKISVCKKTAGLNIRPVFLF